ncbi:hypothetical protein [Mucilaginibacter sp. L3T2-6]|uniref:hypothetical protein n=1 Tax=Mucilaginibacter sp. L3T2-6 TaxID=3062491 RepID=UPI002675C3ED|nr:hypothetical protein [Mucilaginibacter sp. L3T2-6]MDO3641324.1 hypothetical protein [Mucilaginibacter sp. L3T2-6]MDV6213915.1 hypothetical protein [Mucilaginibacter sp. L3T2-6]
MKTTDYQKELLDTIIDLQERGFDHDFVLDHEYIRCLQNDELIAPDDFEIVESHHCQDKIKHNGNCILYAIELKNHPVKGLLMSNYKSFSNGISLHLWHKFYKELQKKYNQVQPRFSGRPLLYT